MSGLTTAVVTDGTRLEALAEEWDRLYRRCPTATPFLSHGWLLAYWRAFGDRTSLRVACVRTDAGDLVAAAPLRLRRRLGLRYLAAVGAELSDFTDVLLDPAVPRAAAALGDGLLALPGWDAVELAEVPPGAAAWDLACGWAGPYLAHRASTCLELPVTAPDAALAALPAKPRQDLRRHMRRADGLGLRAVPVAADDAAITEAVGELLDLHRRQWAGRPVNPEHLTPRFRRHLTDAARALVPAGRAALSRHLLDGRVAAVSLYLLTTDTVGGYLYGVDPEVRSRVDVTALMIRSGLELGQALGATRLDLLRGAEPGKLRWQPAPRYNRCLRLLPPRLGGAHAMTGAQLLARAAVARLRGTRSHSA